MRKTLLTFGALCATLLAPLALHSPLAQVAPTTLARVIVKYKADSALVRNKQGQSLSVAQQVNPAEAMGRRMGLALRPGAGVGDRTHVVFASGMTSAQLAQRLAAESDVEYAVPDQRRRAHVAPNDSLYGAGLAFPGPVVGQWYLRAPDNTSKSAINAEAAWGVTTGSADVVVAVLDSGVRFDHPDMKKLAAGGNLLDGYDMIADLDTSNDGNGRDADASDPGDWISQADLDSGKYSPACTAIEDSTWHGTQTAALIGALTDNATGMASVGRRVQVLPVRVLGKCGGFDSDIVAAMKWAAGIDVQGVPHNNNPAWVINMSLGGAGTCDLAGQTLYADAVAAITQRRTVIVASAGNDYGKAVNTPANCPGVIAVGGLHHAGIKADFSDIGPEVAVSAPGGDCVFPTGACQYPILTATNAGKTTPAGSDYTSAYGFPSLGTSFSAPLVAGTVALMLSADPTLTPAEVKSLLQSSARAFPTGAAQCVAPNSGQQLECACTTSTCGAGMLDAGAALLKVRDRVGLVANISVSTLNPAIGSPIELSAVNTSQAPGGVSPSYLWELVDKGGIVSAFSSGTNASTARITPSAGGRFTVKLTVTDNNGTSSTIASVYVPSPAPPPPADSGGGGAVGAGWLALLLGAAFALRRAT